MNSPIRGETVVDESAEEVLDQAQAAQRWPQPGRSGVAGGYQREGVRVGYRNGSHLMGEGLQVTLPGLRELGVEVFFQPSQHLGDDGLKEVLTRPDTCRYSDIASTPKALPKDRIVSF